MRISQSYSLDHELVASMHKAVERGAAKSVSAFVEDAIRVKLGKAVKPAPVKKSKTTAPVKS